MLNEALINMEKCGAFVALWAHSHPGSGASTTQPSRLDLEQQSQWAPHYSFALTGRVMSEDGYFRFFGDAYHKGEAGIEFEGNGITRVKEAEDHVYRIIS